MLGASSRGVRWEETLANIWVDPGDRRDRKVSARVEATSGFVSRKFEFELGGLSFLTLDFLEWFLQVIF